MSETIRDAMAKSMGDQTRELHLNTLSLVLSCMAASIGIHHVRAILLGVAEELAEFDKGEPNDRH